MAKIKIESNPYLKSILFKSWDTASNEWKMINLKENSNSQLLRNDLVTGFFPLRRSRFLILLFAIIRPVTKRLTSYLKEPMTNIESLNLFVTTRSM